MKIILEFASGNIKRVLPQAVLEEDSTVLRVRSKDKSIARRERKTRVETLGVRER